MSMDYQPSESATVAEPHPLKQRATVKASVPAQTSAAALGRSAQLVAAAQDFVMLNNTKAADAALKVAAAYDRLAKAYREQEQAFLAFDPEGSFQ